MSTTELWVGLTSLFLALHLWAEHGARPTAIVVTKLLASTGFLLTALSVDALAVPWGRWLFAGLCLAWLGDACLLSRARPAFLAGLGAFLLGHVGYCIAFFVHGVDLHSTLTAIPPLGVAALVIDRWLRPKLDAAMRLPVRAYIVVISAMVALAFGAWRAGASDLILLGALSFYLSDLSVARDRFVRREFLNRLWGLPAYYLGQLCLALSICW
ncbi:MAG: lysoplasmalogenase [Myxococcales bacterium]|nr:lysoplasmalogenase [Myxococcales bacterium]